MDNQKQIAAFANELDNLCDRYAHEFDLSSAAACGVLMMKIRLIQDSTLNNEGEKK